MLLFELIKIKYPDIKEEDCKIHIAVANTSDTSDNINEDPVDLYLSGDFEKWQSGQSKENFKRKYIISLAKLPGENRWLFVGGFISKSCEYNEEEKRYTYDTEEINGLDDLTGKLIVSFKRPSRQSYLDAEKWSGGMKALELMPKKMTVRKFAGYNKVIISKKELELIIDQSIESWKGALSNVSGIYLITDTKTGKLYVGSATGEGGIWSRWSDYSKNGHGGNDKLIKILKDEGAEYSDNFQYSVLEIADTHSSKDDVSKREIYWKNVLCSRDFGYNAN
jgi:hypothetical protein